MDFEPPSRHRKYGDDKLSDALNGPAAKLALVILRAMFRLMHRSILPRRFFCDLRSLFTVKLGESNSAFANEKSPQEDLLRALYFAIRD